MKKLMKKKKKRTKNISQNKGVIKMAKKSKEKKK